MDLNGDRRGSIYQDLATTPGATSELSFAMAGNPDEQGVKRMSVLWNGAEVDQPTFDTTGHARYGSMGWTIHSYSVQATGLTSRLEFDSMAPSSPYGPALDDVQ